MALRQQEAVIVYAVSPRQGGPMPPLSSLAGRPLPGMVRAGSKRHDREAKPPKEGAITPPAKTESKAPTSTAEK